MINHYDTIMNFLIQTVATLLTPFLLVGSSIGSFFVPQTQVEEPTLGASQAIPTTIAFFETTLASAISSSATSFTLTSATDKDGTTLASSTYAFVIDEGSSNEEIVVADCTATACTNASRGVSVRTGNTEVTALKKAHRRGASVKITDAPILPLLTRISRGEEGLPSASYYNSTVSTSSFSNDQQLVSKGYVDYLAFNGAGVIDALETTKGVVELATTLEQASSTLSGSSGPLVLQAKNATSTYNAATAGLKVVVTQNNGKIDDNFLSTPSASTTIGKLTLYAGETINGATTPVPVYINKQDNRVYAADGNATTSMKYVGFAITNATASTTITVQTTGIVSGFSALSEGEKYYVSDTAGSISSTIGTYEVLVGVALNTTQLLIQKGKRYASGYISQSDAADTIVSVGFRPSTIRVHAFQDGATEIPSSHGGWTVYGGNKCIHSNDDTSGDAQVGTTNQAFYVVNGGSNGQQGTIQSVTDDGFTVEVSSVGSPQGLLIFWEAEGEM